MLSKIFGNKKCTNLPSKPLHSKALAIPSGPVLKQSRALKIIHAGGHVEYYYMAIPASRIIEKYPAFILARPEIFRRPWDSVVRPEEILIPGQRYYIVPCQTVKKLWRRVKKTSIMDPDFSLVENASQDSLSASGILVKPGLKVKALNLHVTFLGIESTKGEKSSKEKSRNPKMNEKRRRSQKENAWEPSFNAINE
ncbi:hypothetical protein CDL12_15877 [Handroanthus impetiginosus]|uniref:Uncharacterized protein n=1 Tax=Handroanthus impetiginosus TaxID=429701 RepID=A0A2G9H1V4_9LAMI|nr:hypothetical protein CDL12_15877 [Handroanthus impetiginosus]